MRPRTGQRLSGGGHTEDRSADRALGIKHLIYDLWNIEGTVLLGATKTQRCNTNNDEVGTREWDKISGIFAVIIIQLTR